MSTYGGDSSLSVYFGYSASVSDDRSHKRFMKCLKKKPTWFYRYVSVQFYSEFQCDFLILFYVNVLDVDENV